MYINTINITFTQTYNNKTHQKSSEKIYKFKVVFIVHTQTAHRLQFMYNLNMCENMYNRACKLMSTHKFNEKTFNAQTYF